jgi:hypothetical protein
VNAILYVFMCCVVGATLIWLGRWYAFTARWLGRRLGTWSLKRWPVTPDSGPSFNPPAA